MIDLARFGTRAAIYQDGVSHTYAELARRSALGARHSALGGGEARVVFLVPPGFIHVAVQQAIWGAGAIAVPLALSHPARELEYILDDSGAGLAIASPALSDRLRPLAEARRIPFLTTDHLFAEPQAPSAERRAPNPAYPLLRAALSGPAPIDLEADFEVGLDLQLDGIEAARTKLTPKRKRR